MEDLIEKTRSSLVDNLNKAKNMIREFTPKEFKDEIQTLTSLSKEIHDAISGGQISGSYALLSALVEYDIALAIRMQEICVAENKTDLIETVKETLKTLTESKKVILQRYVNENNSN